MAYASPTQLTTFDRCGRQWYFEQIVKIRVDSSTPQEMGNALHLLCASWLLDEPVPENWHEKITPDEREQCRNFLDKAVAKGVLVRRPDLMVEHKFDMRMGQDTIGGRIDVLDPAGVVEDHKTVGSKRWAKKAEELRTDIPMMTYAGYALKHFERVNEVRLRHNQFFKDSGDVDFVEVTVTRDEVRQFWKERNMAILDRMAVARKAREWKDVPGHELNSEPCKAYGGCAYVPICHRAMSIEAFKNSSQGEREVPF